MGSPTGTVHFHSRIRAAHRRECRRLGRGRVGSLKRFAARTATRRTCLQPYLNQAHSVLAVRLNPASRVATRLRVNLKDADAYEALCRALGAEEILAGVGPQARSLDRVPREAWPHQAVLRARVPASAPGDVRPAAAPAALHPDRPGQLQRAYTGLAERIAEAVRADVQPLGTVAGLRAYVTDAAKLRAAVHRAQPAMARENVEALAAAVGEALHDSRRVLRRVKKLRERETMRQPQSTSVAAHVSRATGAWSDDDDDDAELVAARRELAARRAALEAARTRPLNDAERDELAHEGELVAAVVRAHLTTAPTATLRARLVAAAERSGAAIGCPACGGKSKKGPREKKGWMEAVEPGRNADDEDAVVPVPAYDARDWYEFEAAGAEGEDGMVDPMMVMYDDEDAYVTDDEPLAWDDVSDGDEGYEQFAFAQPTRSEAAYEDGEPAYADGEAVYEDGEAVYEDGEAAYEDGEAAYEDGEATYEVDEDGEVYEVYEDDESAYDRVPALEYVGLAADLDGEASSSAAVHWSDAPTAFRPEFETFADRDVEATASMPELVDLDAPAATDRPAMPELVHVGAPVRVPRPALVPLARVETEDNRDDDLPNLTANESVPTASVPSAPPSVNAPIACASEAELHEHLVGHRAHYDAYRTLCDDDVGASLVDARVVYLQPIEEYGSYLKRKLPRANTAEKSRLVAAMQRVPSDGVTAYTPRVHHAGVTFVLCPATADDDDDDNDDDE